MVRLSAILEWVLYIAIVLIVLDAIWIFFILFG